MNKENKGGLSEVVGYVLLISMALALSVIVYNGLKGFTTNTETIECNDGTSVVLNSYDCIVRTSDHNVTLNLTIKNRGMFTINGIYIRVSNYSGARFGEIQLDKVDFTSIFLNFEPGKNWSQNYSIMDARSASTIASLKDITFIELQPYTIQGTKEILCKEISKQPITCTPI